MQADPGEQFNVASKEADLAELLSSRVLDFVVNLGETSIGDSQLVEADEKMLESLRALGYVQ